MQTHNCRCTYHCLRKGDCKACIAYHRESREFPACFFSEEGELTYDRSFENLLEYYRYK